MITPTEVLTRILKAPTDIENVRSLVTDDVIYVSLNYDNPELKRVMPWAGTSRGPEAIVRTFVDVARYWKAQAFEIEALLEFGESAAMFGRFTYKSNVLSKSVTSPFAILARVTSGRCTYLHSWRIRSRPGPLSAAAEAGTSRAIRMVKRLQFEL